MSFETKNTIRNVNAIFEVIVVREIDVHKDVLDISLVCVFFFSLSFTI